VNLHGRRLLLVLANNPRWQCEDDGPRRMELHRHVAPMRVRDYFPIVRNWASRKDRIEVNGTVYPVSTGNQVWYLDRNEVTICFWGGGERCITTMPAPWLFQFVAQRRESRRQPSASV